MTYKIILVNIFIIVLTQFKMGIAAAVLSEENVILTETNDVSDNQQNSKTFSYNYIQSIWGDTNNRENIRNIQANFMKHNMDLTIDPCDDFYQYACGNWGVSNEIPADENEYNIFVMLNSNLKMILNELLLNRTNLIEEENDFNAENKAKNFYLSCMNAVSQKAEGIEKIMEIVKSLGGWPVLDPNWNDNNFTWLNLAEHLASHGEEIFLGTYIGDDLKDVNENIIYITSDYLVLSNRDDYLLESNKERLEAYNVFITTILNELGVAKSKAKQTANEIIEFEIKLAKIHNDPKERRKLAEMYNPMTVNDLHLMYPEINWQRFLTSIYEKQINLTQSVILMSKNYTSSLIDLLSKTDNRIIANYMFWRWTDTFVEELGALFEEATTEFNAVINGQKKSQPRWKKCVLNTNDIFGMPIATMFIRKYFHESARNDVIDVTTELKNTFKEILENIDWIDDETKEFAKLKVNEVVVNVGYPDYIKPSEYNNDKYRDLKIHPNKYFENTLNFVQFDIREQRKKLNTKVDRNEWPTFPTMVNAYYERTRNRIIIPAGILQPPIYHNKFPRSLKYAGIGALVGHELTHGFDDRGRNFDMNGNMNDWWTNSSKEAFDERTKCFITQYENFHYHGMKIQGKASQGENIADNGGLRQAFISYKKWLEDNKNSDEFQYETLPGLNLTNTQLFFLSYAQNWCGTILPEAVENKVKTDTHSPGQIRAIAAVMNHEEFAKEFKCNVDSPMNPRIKCRLW